MICCGLCFYFCCTQCHFQVHECCNHSQEDNFPQKTCGQFECPSIIGGLLLEPWSLFSHRRWPAAKQHPTSCSPWVALTPKEGQRASISSLVLASETVVCVFLQRRLMKVRCLSTVRKLVENPGADVLDKNRKWCWGFWVLHTKIEMQGKKCCAVKFFEWKAFKAGKKKKQELKCANSTLTSNPERLRAEHIVQWLLG